MTKKTIYTIIALFSIVSLVTVSAFAEGKRFNRNRMQANCTQLNLTDDQKVQFDKNRADQRKEMIRIHSKISIAKIEMHEMVKDKTFNKDDVKVQIEKIINLKSEMELTKLDSMDKMRTILTDEQWELFSEMFGKKRGKAFRGKRSEGRHHRGNFGNGRFYGQNPMGNLENNQ